MIDLHTHILPGLDDGARTVEDALAMARTFVADGVTTVAATPHVRDDYPTSADAMLRGVESLQRELDAAGIGLTVLPGAEVAVRMAPRREPSGQPAAMSSRALISMGIGKTEDGRLEMEDEREGNETPRARSFSKALRAELQANRHPWRKRLPTRGCSNPTSEISPPPTGC